jgi:hypothetical protein
MVLPRQPKPPAIALAFRSAQSPLDACRVGPVPRLDTPTELAAASDYAIEWLRVTIPVVYD